MNQMSTGASSDFQSATDTARNMVVFWGMSEKLGTRVYSYEQGITESKTVSEETTKLINDEINRVIDEPYDRAKQILEDSKDIVETMTKYLLEWETLDSQQIDDIMNGIEPKAHSDMGNGKQPPSDSSGDDSAEPEVDLDNPVKDV